MDEKERQERIWKDLEELGKRFIRWDKEEEERRAKSKEELKAYYKGM